MSERKSLLALEGAEITSIVPSPNNGWNVMGRTASMDASQKPICLMMIDSERAIWDGGGNYFKEHWG